MANMENKIEGYTDENKENEEIKENNKIKDDMDGINEESKDFREDPEKISKAKNHISKEIRVTEEIKEMERNNENKGKLIKGGVNCDGASEGSSDGDEESDSGSESYLTICREEFEKSENM